MFLNRQHGARPMTEDIFAAILTGTMGIERGTTTPPHTENTTEMLNHQSALVFSETPSFKGILAKHPGAARMLARELDRGISRSRDKVLRKLAPLVRSCVQDRDQERSTLQGMISMAPYHEVLRAAGELTQREDELTKILQGLRQTWKRRLQKELHADEAAIHARARQLASREEKIKDFFGTSPGLWDLEEGAWNDIDWTGIEMARDYLKRYPELRELARRLGRSWAPARKPRRIPRLMVVQEARDEAMGRSELVAYQEGKDLEQTLASEFALLSDPALSDLFLQRYADGRLNCRAYHTHEETVSDRGRKIVVYDEEPQAREQGPVILCVDTSGSMIGEPEQCAKALALLFGGICIEEGRKAYLIAFSSKIRTFDLSNPATTLGELSRFLAGGFHGGTDLRPALAHAAELLLGENFMHADILVLSDFKVPKLLIKKAGLVHLFRTDRQSRIHGISVNEEGLNDDLNLFDSTWHFAIERPDRAGGISEQQFRKNSL